MNKKVKLAIIGVVALGVAIGGFFGIRAWSQTAEYRRIVSEIEINMLDLSNVQDGTWSGHFYAILVSADVDVTVEDGVITDITIQNHHHGRAQAKEAEVVTDRVIEGQTLNVDTVSGATNSSLVILQAIQNALEEGKR